MTRGVDEVVHGLAISGSKAVQGTRTDADGADIDTDVAGVHDEGTAYRETAADTLVDHLTSTRLGTFGEAGYDAAAAGYASNIAIYHAEFATSWQSRFFDLPPNPTNKEAQLGEVAGTYADVATARITTEVPSNPGVSKYVEAAKWNVNPEARRGPWKPFNESDPSDPTNSSFSKFRPFSSRPLFSPHWRVRLNGGQPEAYLDSTTTTTAFRCSFPEVIAAALSDIPKLLDSFPASYACLRSELTSATKPSAQEGTAVSLAALQLVGLDAHLPLHLSSFLLAAIEPIVSQATTEPLATTQAWNTAQQRLYTEYVPRLARALHLAAYVAYGCALLHVVFMLT